MEFDSGTSLATIQKKNFIIRQGSSSVFRFLVLREEMKFYEVSKFVLEFCASKNSIMVFLQIG